MIGVFATISTATLAMVNSVTADFPLSPLPWRYLFYSTWNLHMVDWLGQNAALHWLGYYCCNWTISNTVVNINQYENFYHKTTFVARLNSHIEMIHNWKHYVDDNKAYVVFFSWLWSWFWFYIAERWGEFNLKSDIQYNTICQVLEFSTVHYRSFQLSFFTTPCEAAQK